MYLASTWPSFLEKFIQSRVVQGVGSLKLFTFDPLSN